MSYSTDRATHSSPAPTGSSLATAIAQIPSYRTRSANGLVSRRSFVPNKPKRAPGVGSPARNRVTGLLDSYFYDLDIAIGVIRPELLVLCFEALTQTAQRAVRNHRDVETIPVHYARRGPPLATKFISTGVAVIMCDAAPWLVGSPMRRRLRVLSLPTTESRKSPGEIRCRALSLYGAPGEALQDTVQRSSLPAGRERTLCGQSSTFRPRQLAPLRPRTRPSLVPPSSSARSGLLSWDA